MAEEIVVRVEIIGAEYEKDFKVDPDSPLADLLLQVAEEEGIPLRKKSGHPLPWTGEGPDIREGHEGEWTELTRTQPLSRVSKVIIERYGERSPLFSIRFGIPGAAESLVGKREEEKRAEIEARMAQRAAERDANEAAARAGRLAELGDDDETDLMVMDLGARGKRPPPNLEVEPATIRDEGLARRAQANAGAAVGAAVGAGALGAAVAGGLEGRIRRRSGEGAATESGPAGPEGGRGGKDADAGRKSARAKAGKGGGEKGGGEKGGGKGAAGKGAARGAAKGAAGQGLFASGPLANLPKWALPAAGGGALALIALVVLLSSGPEPEPEPTPAPTPAAAVRDIEVITPPPPPPPPPPSEEVTPPPMEGFYSRAGFSSYQAKEVSAQLTSFAKTNVQISYSVTQPDPGLKHSLAFAGRFKLTVSDSGGDVDGRSFSTGVTPGTATRVDLRYDGTTLTVRVGGKRAGAWPIADSGGFPKWTFDLDPGVDISGLKAAAQVDAPAGGG